MFPVRVMITAAATAAMLLVASPAFADNDPTNPAATNPSANNPDSGPTAGPTQPATTGPAAAPGPRSALGGAQLAGLGIVTNSTLPLPGDLSAASWLVADLDTGTVLGAKDPHAELLPASTLKTLTALTLLPKIPPTTMVTVTDADATVDGTRVGLVPGEAYSADELFHAMLLGSANDAAEALSHAVETRDQTLSDMNALAHQLQADDTVAGTPSGLDTPDEHSSAYDLALIARAGLKLPAFAADVALDTAPLHNPKGAPLVVTNHNNVLRSYPGSIGVKNGYTVAAGHCLVEAATRNGRRVIVVIMKGDGYEPYTESIHLLDWAFSVQASGVPGVGTLVDPLPATQPVAATVTAPTGVTKTTTLGRAVHPAGDDTLRNLTLLVLGSAAVGVLVNRRRRRAAAGTHLASLRQMVRPEEA